LYFFNARWYDSYLNRWIQPDQIIPDPYNPLDWDRYSFVRNNPVTYIDADGHFPILPVLFLVGAFIFFSQVPSDQYQPDPANWGNATVMTVGAALMVVPAALSFFCSNDGDCTNEAQIAANVGQDLGQDGNPVNELDAATKSAQSVIDKLSQYLLNLDHLEGASKAKWFEQALGFTKENMAELAKQIIFDPTKANPTDLTQYGQKFEQVISITGANGKVIDVIFVWIRNLDGVVRLVTSIPTSK
jgi:hypothetical protein